ncbi:hypothetical protein ACWEKT_29585 [Nocardia takedensis]
MADPVLALKIHRIVRRGLWLDHLTWAMSTTLLMFDRPRRGPEFKQGVCTLREGTIDNDAEAHDSALYLSDAVTGHVIGEGLHAH